MNSCPNFARYPGMGDLPGDSTNPNSPDYVERESILDCPNETGTWLAENMAEPIQTRAIEIIGDFLAGPRDQFANARLLREVMDLAAKCEDAIRAFEAKGDDA